MKRILALVLVMVMALSFTACGKVKELTDDELIRAAKDTCVEGYPDKTIGEYYDTIEGYYFVTGYSWFVLDDDQVETFKVDIDPKKEDALMHMMNMDLDSGEASMAGIYIRNKKSGKLEIDKAYSMQNDNLVELDVDDYMGLIIGD